MNTSQKTKDKARLLLYKILIICLGFTIFVFGMGILVELYFCFHPTVVEAQYSPEELKTLYTTMFSFLGSLFLVTLIAQIILIRKKNQIKQIKKDEEYFRRLLPQFSGRIYLKDLSDRSGI